MIEAKARELDGLTADELEEDGDGENSAFASALVEGLTLDDLSEGDAETRTEMEPLFKKADTDGDDILGLVELEVFLEAWEGFDSVEAGENDREPDEMDQEEE